MTGRWSRMAAEMKARVPELADDSVTRIVLATQTLREAAMRGELSRIGVNIGTPEYHLIWGALAALEGITRDHTTQAQQRAAWVTVHKMYDAARRLETR